VLDFLAHGWSLLQSANGKALLEAALPPWLQRQRWFAAKTHTMQSVRVVEWVELPAASSKETPAGDWSPIEGIAPALLFIRVEYGDNASEIYQLPLGIAAGAAAEQLDVRSSTSVIARFPSQAGPAVLHDASVSEEFRQSLLRLIGSPADEAPRQSALREPQAAGHSLPDVGRPRSGLPGPGLPESDRLSAHASAAFAHLRGNQPLPSRVSSAEQSNTSILFGDRLILKIFRRIQPGENPEVEIGRFLTEVAHFPRIAPFLGEIALTATAGEKTTIAILQGLVPNQGDGWQWVIAQLQVFFSSVAALPAPPLAPVANLFASNDAPAEMREHAGKTLAAIALLGRRTAEMHLALATPTADPAFAAESITAAELARDAQRIESEIASTFELLQSKLSALTGVTADQAELVLSRRADLLARSSALAAIGNGGQRIRIHGDYHLGQTLRTVESANEPGDFVLLDFEGEPARPLAERRQKQSPLKDVAGMIRSFSYAAYSGLDKFIAGNLNAAQGSANGRLAAWAHTWQNAASREFLKAYCDAIAANPGLLPAQEQAQPLLNAYLLEKALYELRYELNNRPAWLHIPLSGILHL
jgi:maltose alpha-D-glucosyltransferase / alpha-amylase